MMTLTEIREAVARGWCAPANSKKVMDVDLASAIADEVWAEVEPALARTCLAEAEARCEEEREEAKG
jgi:hypothetical protein